MLKNNYTFKISSQVTLKTIVFAFTYVFKS